MSTAQTGETEALGQAQPSYCVRPSDEATVCQCRNQAAVGYVRSNGCHSLATIAPFVKLCRSRLLMMSGIHTIVADDRYAYPITGSSAVTASLSFAAVGMLKEYRAHLGCTGPFLLTFSVRSFPCLIRLARNTRSSCSSMNSFHDVGHRLAVDGRIPRSSSCFMPEFKVKVYASDPPEPEAMPRR
jgi:hypothetical protein